MSTAIVSMVALWVTVYFTVSLVAVVRALRTKRSHAAKSSGQSVLVIRPCTGGDAYLSPALHSTAALAKTPGLRVVLSVADASDPAWPIVQSVAQDLRAHGMDASARVCPTEAPNRKVGQLACATDDAPEDAIVCIDADVDLHGFDLEALLGVLQRAHCGAAWAPPVEVAEAQTWGDRASASILGASLHAFPLLGQLDRDGLVGKLFAVRRDALQSVGGFASLGQVLGEDMALAERLRARGWRTAMHPQPARSIATGRGLVEIVERYTRWLWVIRAQRPALLASYPLLLAAAPLLLLASLGVLAFDVSIGLGLLAAVLTSRVVVAGTASWCAGQPLWTAVLQAPLADLTLLAAFVRALGQAEVKWRGHALRLDAHGRLSAATPSSLETARVEAPPAEASQRADRARTRPAPRATTGAR